MSLLSKQEQLRQLLDEQQEQLHRTFPASTSRGRAVVALTRARDWCYLNQQDMSNSATTTYPPYLYSSGWQKALQLCFGPTAPLDAAPLVLDEALDAWADQILLECDVLAAGEQILAYCETGFMSMQQGAQKDFAAWLASKRMPTEWVEHADMAWLTTMFAKKHERETQKLSLEKAAIQQQLDVFVRQWRPDMPIYRTTYEIDDYYTRLGMLRVKSMACHLLYPPQTLIGGCTIEQYTDVLAVLIGWALKHLDLCRAFVVQHPSPCLRTLLAPPQQTAVLIDALSEILSIERTIIRRAIDAYSLAHENASYHYAVTRVPVPPLLRLDEQQLVWSLLGMLGEPLFFLTRELKRRYSDEYHNASRLREEVFRQDLYQLFADKRFVRSADSVELRGVQGDLTTDVDALIFDRKTGMLALFELKSQDPFAYSLQERLRQRDYFYNAGKQVLACVQWLKRNGANALLTRLDYKQVKRLKVQKTYIFVLGRYLAHFFDGPAFDQRAAWGTWPQVLRLVNATSFDAEEAHPIQSLYKKLLKDTPLLPSSPVVAVQEILLGEHKIYVYPDFKSYKNRAAVME